MQTNIYMVMKKYLLQLNLNYFTAILRKFSLNNYKSYFVLLFIHLMGEYFVFS